MEYTKITQYIHRPGATELGQWNTHETYMRIANDKDLTNIFPIGEEVEVIDTINGKLYRLKSAFSNEFRVNQMGELYRDYNMHPGDEVVISQIETKENTTTYVTIKTYNRVVIEIGTNGAEIVNSEYLQHFVNNEDNSIMLSIIDKDSTTKDFKATFSMSKKKRDDSPTTTKFYTVVVDNTILPKGTYYLTLGDKNILQQLPKSEYNVVEVEAPILSKSQKVPTFSPLPTTTTPQQQQFVTNILATIRTKPFILLAGISGTGKSQLVRRLAQATNDINVTDDTRFKEPNPVNFKLIQVKPNWHNSMEVIGYKTNIPTDHYVLTEFIRFIARAWAFPNTPFFLCLDEMNLAPVEEYFAEFLSAIESRTKNTSNGYFTDPIIPPFDNYGKVVASQLVTDLLTDKLLAETPQRDTITKTWCERGLSLPENLIVMGTVNMDETTFSFSKKVLDRAMSIEMNVVDYNAYLSQTSDPINVKLVDYNDFIINRPIEGATITNIDKQDIVTWLQTINQILDNTPFKLGYRAINEAILYISATTALKLSTNVAKDQFAMMKILSRIEGDDSKIGNILDELKKPLNGPLCTKKLTDMQQLLNTNQFTSFWN